MSSQADTTHHTFNDDKGHRQMGGVLLFGAE